MSKITATRLSRAKYRIGTRVMDGKKVDVNRITGYEPAQAREVAKHPKKDNLSALVSPGQRLNWGREAYRKGLNRYTRR